MPPVRTYVEVMLMWRWYLICLALLFVLHVVQLHGVYMAMLTNMQTAITARPASGFLAYNLLLTPSFLLMVPRREQSFEGVEVNSIGFIGSFFVKNDTQRAFFEQKGPMELLRQVTFPSLPTSTT